MSGLPADPAATGSTNLPEVSVTAPAPQLPVPAQAVTHDGGPQWLRRWSLTVYGGASSSTTVLELTAGQQSALGGPPATSPQGQPLAEGLRMKFRTFALDEGIPNHAEITVWNLKDETASRLTNKEFSKVVLQAGYSTGRFGAIFVGTIKEVKRARGSATDTYLTIYAADSDIGLTQTPLDPITLPRGSTALDMSNAIAAQMKEKGLIGGSNINLAGGTGGILLNRSKIIYGLANENLNTTSKPTSSWSIQNGVLQIVPIKGYLPDEAVILNAQTGLIGQPESRQDGIFVTCLLNPALKVRGLIKINNGDVNTSEPAIGTTTVVEQGYPGFHDNTNFFASTSADGTYVVIYLEYEGDTRANPWYAHICCLLIDQSSNQIAPGNSLPKFTLDPATFPGHL